MWNLPRLSLDLLFCFHLRVAKDTKLTIAITTIIMPTIAPIGNLREEPESPAPASEVRLGIFAKVEKEGWNVM
jgi:hypothetical protein